MSEMLEKCAMAIQASDDAQPFTACACMGKESPDDWACPCLMRSARRYAAAVLDALMEPDMDMILAGESALEEFEDSGYDSDVDGNAYPYTYRMPGWERHVLRAMITAAKETK